jgi:hypothetical protein
MQMKNFKKAVWVLAAVILSISAAWAAPSTLVGGSGQKGDSLLERDIEDGVKITLQKIYKTGSDVWIQYIVLSEEDTIIKIEVEGDNGTLFDDAGNKFSSRNGWTRIGNEKTIAREIIGGVPTAVLVGYEPGEKYTLPEKFARAAVNINGKKLLFRDIPGNHGN